MAPDNRLPEFDTPPVVEVALSVQFDSPSLTVPTVALWWNQIRTRFPNIQQVGPVAPAIENFDQPTQSGQRVELQLLEAPPPTRLFMITESLTDLVQVQDDRFGYSWRKLKPDHEYPRYSTIREKFSQEWRSFEKFLEVEQLGPLHPIQCEVTYVNHIRKDDVWANHGELHKVIPSVTPKLTDGFLPAPEATHFASKYIARDPDGEPVARLHVQVEPRYIAQGTEPIFYMTLTVRGAPQTSGLAGIVQTMDTAHEWIVRGFATLTSPEMHQAWRRTQ